MTDRTPPSLSSGSLGAKRTVVGTLLNFRGVLDKLGDQVTQKPYNAPPRAPVLYIRPENTWASAGATIVLPPDVAEVELGATLGVVIGRTACRVPAEHALDFIGGYAIVNDLTVPHDSVYRPAMQARCRDSFCPMGPVLPRDRLSDPDSVALRAYVNGELRQQNTTRNLVRSVARLLADVTEFMTLSAGDVLLVGVPESAPVAVAGDRVAVEIDGLGRLENVLASEAATVDSKRVS